MLMLSAESSSPKIPRYTRKLRKTMVNTGCSMDPHQAFLVLRGVKTLGLRVERAQENAMQIARWLVNQPEVASVSYIGLESHPQHDLAKRQMRGFGSMISFELKGGFEAGRTLMDHLRVATLLYRSAEWKPWSNIRLR